MARLLRGYTFLSRNYNPGDRIVLVGLQQEHGPRAGRLPQLGWTSGLGRTRPRHKNQRGRLSVCRRGLVPISTAAAAKHAEPELARSLDGFS